MFKFPFTNFHELNLDWILSVVKEAKEVFDNGRTDIDYAVETADEAKTIAEQAAQATIPDGAVTTIKLANEAVTAPKIATGAVTSGKLANESVTLSKLANGTIIRRNMLDNWYFGGGGSQNTEVRDLFPINQRGQNVYNLDGETSIDRWSGKNVKVTLSPNTINVKFGNGGSTRQRFRQKLSSPLRVGTYTFSVACIINTNDNNTLKLAISDNENIQQSSSEAFGTFSNIRIIKWTFTQLEQINNPYVEIITDRTSTDVIADLNIVAVKLELGNTQTLGFESGNTSVLNEFPDFNTELEKCERYLFKSGTIERIRASLVVTNSIQFFIPTPSPLDRNPSASDFSTCIIERLDGTAQTGFTLSVLMTNPASNGFIISAAKTAHGLSDAVLNLNGVLISAE